MAKSSRAQTAAKAGGREYLVQDRAAFAAVLNDVIASTFNGNRSEAARSAGVSQSTLRNFCEQRCAAVRHETLLRLFKIVGRQQVGIERQVRLQSALLSPRARDRLDRYRAWVETETHAIIRAGRMPEIGKGDLSVEIESGRLNDEWESAMDALSICRNRFPSYWKPLERRLKELGVGEDRAMLSRLRVLAPLLAFDASAHIERDFRSVMEESNGETLRRFVDAGIKRELIVLDRENDILRAQLADKTDWHLAGLFGAL